jgi:hypothetical protein
MFRPRLNIFHAELDIMQSKIEANSGGPVVIISPETAKMIRNMFSASETAIHILNDLLHYTSRYLPCLIEDDNVCKLISDM